MAIRTLGVEEELFLVDPATRTAAARAPQVLDDARRHGDPLEHELFRHQVEIQTEPVTDADTLRAQLVAARRTAGRAAAQSGLVLAAGGVVPTLSPAPVVTDTDRYRDMVASFGDVALQGGTCGMHVHVGVDSDREGIAVVDALGPLLSTVLALSANSPITRGHDTGYASWRSHQWSQWPTAGPTQPFGTRAAYDAMARALVETGAARDTAMLYYDARLAERYPTVEVRVCDVVTDVDDVVALALLVRALVETVATRPADPDPPGLQLLRAGRWRAARDGVSGALLRPADHRPAPARDVVAELYALARPALEAAGDAAVVGDGLERLLAGSGAARQRAALERTGTAEGVVDDLVARTARSWA